MTKDNQRAQLDRRLLGLTLQGPRRALVVAIATGIAVGYEFALREDLEPLRRLGVDSELCDSAASVVLEMWAAADRAGGLSEAAFLAAVDKIKTLVGAA